MLGLTAFRSIIEKVAGSLLLIIGFLLRVWATFYFYQQRMRVISLSPQRRLITCGPYRFSRNPPYLGGNVFIFLGAALFFRSRNRQRPRISAENERSLAVNFWEKQRKQREHHSGEIAVRPSNRGQSRPAPVGAGGSCRSLGRPEGRNFAGFAEHFVDFVGVKLLGIDHPSGVFLEDDRAVCDAFQQIAIEGERFRLGF
jgi:hypothetical protein